MYWPSGEISISVRTAGVTVRRTGADCTVPEFAMMFAEPALTPVANPVPAMVATFVALELQVTLLVISVVLPSEKMPLAVKNCACPVAMDALAGVTVIDWSWAAVTVASVVACFAARVAVMVEVPAETPVTNPLGLTVATAAVAEFQVTWEVTSSVVPSP